MLFYGDLHKVPLNIYILESRYDEEKNNKFYILDLCMQDHIKEYFFKIIYVPLISIMLSFKQLFQ